MESQPLTPAEARRRFEAMAALGITAHSPDAWRTMAQLLAASADRAPLGHQAPLLDRARECYANAASSALARCPVNHRTVKLDDAAWSALAYVGMQHIEADEDGPAETLEIRNCGCGTSLARTIATARAA